MTFNRTGDFYTITGPDAKRVASELNLTLQTAGDLPVCGVPAHRLHDTVRDLTDKGYTVTIASPKDAKR